MWMQRLTTKEPDDEMIEVGIASVEAVFDWRSMAEGRRECNDIPGGDCTGWRSILQKADIADAKE